MILNEQKMEICQYRADWEGQPVRVKTRSLLPGMVYYYLTDRRLASIISIILGSSHLNSQS